MNEGACFFPRLEVPGYAINCLKATRHKRAEGKRAMSEPKANAPYMSAASAPEYDRSGDRTHDLKIKSLLLYQLSYPVSCIVTDARAT